MTGLQRIHREKLLGFVSPALFIAAAMVLMNYVDENPNFTADMVEGGFGPTAWPSYMLYGVMFFAGGWLMQELLAFWRAHSAAKRDGQVDSAAPASQAKASDVLEFRILLAIGVIAAYGYLIPLVGFAFATLLFFLSWFVLGGIRKPGMIGSVAVGGTLFMLYLFVKLAAMPLARGEGVFGDWTVALYQMLHVF